MCWAGRALRTAARSSVHHFGRARIPAKKRCAQQVYATLEYEYVTPMLLGAGAYSIAVLADKQDQLDTFQSSIQTQFCDSDGWSAAMQDAKVAATAAIATAVASASILLGRVQRISTDEANAKQPQQQQQQDTVQEDLLEENSKLLAVIQKQQQQLKQLSRDKQQLQQQVKKHVKELDKMKAALANTQHQLSVLQDKHAAAALELIQLRSDLDRAKSRLQAKQTDEETSNKLQAMHPEQTQKGRSKRRSSSSADDQLEQPQASTSGTSLAVAAASALEPSETLRIAFVGGRNMKKSYMRMLPPGAQVRHFGSPQDMGEGQIKSLEASIKAGSIDQVYMLTRWNGHSTTQLVTRLCRQRGIPVHLLDSTQMARKKGQGAAAAASSGSDMSDDDDVTCT